VFSTFVLVDLDLWHLLVVANMSSLDSDSVHGADSGEAGEPEIEPEFNDVRTLPVRSKPCTTLTLISEHRRRLRIR
jgi:hypothetical protein